MESRQSQILLSLRYTDSSNCANCGELVLSLRHRFCPICGCAYKTPVKTQ
ncbi:50S ribosomal protein L32 [Nostoc sp. CHAB 5714]|uniref:Large ribosomal subunit protein bL32 n=1 Tax=Nostoc favosum CHAB5714 TaxID=2780399 RepID=A0ABS8IBJ8_9NOSO|nr:50S ribosomal protein L32 [Nostoc favosum]MCC5600892.1 50S ribosomal protein L32 [Nostoc favosum CHAB5714]